MNDIIEGRYLDKLINRRGQIVMTLRHLGNEQKQVEQNTDWLDQAAYENRIDLLDRLRDWYATEVGEIDKAIKRIERRRAWRSLRKRSFATPASSSAMGCAAFELTTSLDG